MVYTADPNLYVYGYALFQSASDMDFNRIHTWVSRDGTMQWNALQTSNGVHRHFVFQEFDSLPVKTIFLWLILMLKYLRCLLKDKAVCMMEYNIREHDVFHTIHI